MYLKYIFLLSMLLVSGIVFANDSTAIVPDGYNPVLVNNVDINQANEKVANADVLLIQTALPWNSDANTKVLDQLNYTYKSVDMSAMSSTNINDYQVVLIVNDQNQAFYDNYATNYSKFEDYVKNGGTLVFFAVDRGWASGNNKTDLPGGVKVEDRYESYNVIVKSDHPIITEELTKALQIPYRDGALSDSDLSGNYASHNYFPTPPKDAVVLLKEKGEKQATLMVYPLGKGHVIASALTWEYTYARYGGKNKRYGFGRALPDLFQYAFTLAGGLEKQDVSVFLYPEDQYEEKGRETLWKHPGDIFDVVAQVDNNSGEEQSNVSLTFTVDASQVDANHPVYVYRRRQPEDVDRGLNLIKLKEGQDYSIFAGKITLANLSIPEGDATEFVLRFRIDEQLKQSQVIDAQAVISSDVVDSTSKLSDGGTVALTAEGKIILTNRTLFYKYFASDKSIYSYGRIKELWKSLYKVAADSRAVISYVDKYDQDYDDDLNATPTIDWLGNRENITYDADFNTSLEEVAINLVASKIATLERDLIKKSGGNGDGRYVAILGGDEIIPFYRVYDDSKTVLDTCRDSKNQWAERGCLASTSSSVAGTVTLKDTLNGYLLTDGYYRVNDDRNIWKEGTFGENGINVGRIVAGIPSSSGQIAESLYGYMNLLKSSTGIVGRNKNVIKLENVRRDKRLDDYETKMVGGNYTVINSIDTVSLDTSVSYSQSLCPDRNDPKAHLLCMGKDNNNKYLWPINPDEAKWSDIRKFFENGDGYALMRFMTHGSPDGISSSYDGVTGGGHDYSTASNVKLLNSKLVKKTLSKVNPIYIGDACLIGQVENANKNGWINLLLSQYTGGMFASSSITWSLPSQDISVFNDIITANLLAQSSTGKALTDAMSTFAGVRDREKLARIQMNLFGLPWAILAKQKNANNFANANGRGGLKVSNIATEEAGVANSLNKKIQIDTSSYRLRKVGQYDLVLIANYDNDVGGVKIPSLPFSDYAFDIPFNAVDITVKLKTTETKELGKLNIPGIKPQPPTPDWGDQKSGFVDLSGVSGIYPQSALSYLITDTRSSKRVNIHFLPAQYNIDTKETTLITKGEIIVQYTTPDKGVVKSLVTNKYTYNSSEAGIVTATIENTSAADSAFTIDVSILNLANNEVSHKTKSVTIVAGKIGEIQVDFTAPVAGGHYRVKISVSDGGAEDIGESVTDIRVIAKEITKITVPSTVVKKEVVTLGVELANHTSNSVAGVLKLNIYSVNGSSVASLPSKNLTLPANGNITESYPWTANASLSSGSYYVKGVFSIVNEDNLILSSEEFTLVGDEDISLIAGWNLISFPVTPDVANIGQAIAGISGSIRTIWSFSNGQWKSYDTDNPNFSTLTTFEGGVGYWFNMKNNDVLGVKGVTTNSTINLVKGWNLVGYPLSVTKTVSEVMTSINGKFDSVWGYEGGQWKSYDADKPNFSTLSNFKPKSGYWIKARENVSLAF